MLAKEPRHNHCTNENGHGHCHCHHHEHSPFAAIGKIMLALCIFGLGISSVFSPDINRFLFIVSWLIAGSDVIWQAIKNLFNLKWLDENSLMAIATVGAIAIEEHPEAAMVMILYQTGEYLQHKAVEKSKKSIADLMNIRPDSARVIQNREEIVKSPAEVKIGDIILVNSGEKIPLDGMVIEGQANVDTSALTGESLPRRLKNGSEAVSGFINIDGGLKIKVSRTFKESTVNKIIEMVENAESKKARTQKFISRFARFYTPIVVFAAVLLTVIPPLVLKETTFDLWLERALTFLVISCPCALVISVPLTFFAGIGGASKQGILIKGGNFLESLAKATNVVFDKTGTLTKGNFDVNRIVAADGYKEQEILAMAALAEKFSNHPIALSIKRAAAKISLSDISPKIEEMAGLGIKATVGQDEILVGNRLLMERFEIKNIIMQPTLTAVYVAKNRKYMGVIEICDQLRQEAKAAVDELKKMGITAFMLTGDSKQVAIPIAKELNINNFEHSLLPNDKVEKIEKIIASNKNGATVFVGDGINDAPVLARADVGIAMGGLGSDAAIEAADAVIMDDNPQKAAVAIKRARKTMKIVYQNIAFALGVKVLFLILGAFGIVSMWGAVFADTGTALLAILNALRAYKK